VSHSEDIERVLEQIHLWRNTIRNPIQGTWASIHEVYVVVVRVPGHKTPGESSVNITVSSYDTTHLQENPQRLG